MSQPSMHDQLERIRTNALKKAHEAYAQQLELGMNEMIQVAQRVEATPAEVAT